MSMKTIWMYLLMCFLVLSSCKAKKDLQATTSGEVKSEVVENSPKKLTFSIESIDDISKEDLLFSIKDVKIADKKLAVQVQYGGGCVKPHVFELVTDGVIDQTGNMDFYLLHKTHGDKCKALLIENLVFDIENLYSLKSEVLTTVKLNNMRKIDLE